MVKQGENFLEMIPVRNVSEFTLENGKITLLLPKFKNVWLRKWLVPPGKSTHIRLHLDDTGSRIWDLIDGTRNASEICDSLVTFLMNNNQKTDDLEYRVVKFLTDMYKKRIILLEQANQHL